MFGLVDFYNYLKERKKYTIFFYKTGNMKHNYFGFLTSVISSLLPSLSNFFSVVIQKSIIQ